MAQPKPHRSSSFDRCNVKDEVKLLLPEGYEVKVFKATSGDTGKEYFIQVLSCEHGPTILLCDCYAGKFVQPAEILGLGKDLRCKHVRDLLEVIK